MVVTWLSVPAADVGIETALVLEGTTHVSHSPSTPLGDSRRIDWLLPLAIQSANGRVKVTIGNGRAGRNTGSTVHALHGDIGERVTCTATEVGERVGSTDPSGVFCWDGGEGGIDSSSVASAARTLPGRSALRLRVQTLPWAAFVEPEGSHLIFKAPNKKTPQRGAFCLGALPYGYASKLCPRQRLSNPRVLISYSKPQTKKRPRGASFVWMAEKEGFEPSIRD